MLGELEDNVVSRVIQAVGLFGDILSLEDTMEPNLSVGGPERLQSKREEEAEEEDESKKKSDKQNEVEVGQESFKEEVKKNGEAKGGEGGGDLGETEMMTDDHKVGSGVEQKKSVAAGKEDQTSEEIQGDIECSQKQKHISRREIEEEDQAEVEEHYKVLGGTDEEDGEKERVLQGEQGEEEEREMTEKEQKSDDEVESRATELEEQLVEEGREEEGTREMQANDVGEEDNTDQEVSVETQDGGNVDGQEEAAEDKQYEVEVKDLKPEEEENSQKAEEKEIYKEDKGGAEEKTELDEEVEDKRHEGAESRGQSELPVKPGEEMTSKEEDDRQWEEEGDKTMEKEEEAKQGLECMEQSAEKEKEQKDGSAEEAGSAGDDERKDTGKADKEDKTEEEIWPQEEQEANRRQEVKGKQPEEEEEEVVQVALSPVPETGRGRGSEALEAVPAVEEGSKVCREHSQDVYSASLGHHNDPIEEGEEKWDDEEEGEEDQEDEKAEAPDRTQPAPLRDTNVDSAGASQETSQQVEAQQLEERLQAPMTSLPAAGCGVTPEPLSGEPLFFHGADNVDAPLI